MSQRSTGRAFLQRGWVALVTVVALGLGAVCMWKVHQFSEPTPVITVNGLPFSIPAAFFTVGCFYIFGSLEHLHGAQPSERTYLGFITMFTSTNLTMRMFVSGRLKSGIEK